MKKNKAKIKKIPTISPEQAVEFLEGIRVMASEVDEPTVSISLRIPKNILRTLKLKAQADGKKYQSLLVEYIRRGLRSPN